MKKILSGVAALLMVSSVGVASPLTDYSPGKVALDLSVRSSNDLSVAGVSYNGKSSNLNYGATVGLGYNLAFQYKQDNADSDNSGVLGHTVLRSNQYNVLYQLDPNTSVWEPTLSIYAGITDTKTQRLGLGGTNTTGLQVGIMDSFPLADKTAAYASFGYGNKIRDLEFGIGYEIINNLELNVGYKTTNYVKLNSPDGSVFNYDAHGLTYGVTYKF